MPVPLISLLEIPFENEYCISVMKKTVAERKISHLAKVKLLKAELAFEPALPNIGQLMFFCCFMAVQAILLKRIGHGTSRANKAL